MLYCHRQGYKNRNLSVTQRQELSGEGIYQDKIFVTTDASDFGSEVVLSFGPTYETAHPIALSVTQRQELSGRRDTPKLKVVSVTEGKARANMGMCTQSNFRTG